MKSKLMKANFASRCRACDARIEKGAAMWWKKGYGCRCELCGPHTDDDAPLPPRRKFPGGSSKGAPRRPVPTPKPTPDAPITEEKMREIAARYAAGEKIGKLAKELGVSWQFLHGLLNGKNGKPRRPVPKAEPKPLPPVRSGNRNDHRAFKGDDGIHRYEFGSVTEATQFALDYEKGQAPGCRQKINAEMDYALSGSDGWAHRYTRERFLAELETPQQELLDAIERLKEQLLADVPMPTQRRRRIRRGCDWGDEIDPDRWLMRDPDCWERSDQQHVPSRQVTIGCNLSIHCGGKPENLLYRGAAALALADVLTERGVNVEVVAFQSRHRATTTTRRDVERVTIKRSDAPMDLGALAFAMCEIAWFRIVLAYGATRALPGGYKDGFGRPMHLPSRDRAGIDYLIEKDVMDEYAAKRWLTECIESQASEVVRV